MSYTQFLGVKEQEVAYTETLAESDKGGNPYILHPRDTLRLIVTYCGDERNAAKICAVLYEAVEDGTVTVDVLGEQG